MSLLDRKVLFGWIPMIILLCLILLALLQGWHKSVSLEVIGTNYAFLLSFISDNFVTALLIYIVLYVSVVTLSLPLGLPLTVSGGLLFGWKYGSAAAIFSATLGATVLFEIAKTTLGQFLIVNVTPWLKKLREGFKGNALSYLLFLRLVPVFPFFVVNLASAFLNVPSKIFILGTVLGITPATIAFSYAGSGLGSVIEAQNAEHARCLARQRADSVLLCPYHIDIHHLVTKEVLTSFILLGFIALLPAVVRHIKRSDG